MKNTLEGTGNRADCMEERISEPGDMKTEMIQIEEEREIRSKKKKKEEILWELSYTCRKDNVMVMGIPEGEGSREFF